MPDPLATMTCTLICDHCGERTELDGEQLEAMRQRFQGVASDYLAGMHAAERERARPVLVRDDDTSEIVGAGLHGEHVIARGHAPPSKHDISTILFGPKPGRSRQGETMKTKKKNTSTTAIDATRIAELEAALLEAKTRYAEAQQKQIEAEGTVATVTAHSRRLEAMLKSASEVIDGYVQRYSKTADYQLAHRGSQLIQDIKGAVRQAVEVPR